jgi:hypothetical protein
MTGERAEPPIVALDMAPVQFVSPGKAGGGQGSGMAVDISGQLAKSRTNKALAV